jgi:hypothetical protein
VRNLTREIGLEAVMRVRCSKGVSLANHFGNFFIRSTGTSRPVHRLYL